MKNSNNPKTAEIWDEIVLCWEELLLVAYFYFLIESNCQELSTSSKRTLLSLQEEGSHQAFNFGTLRAKTYLIC